MNRGPPCFLFGLSAIPDGHGPPTPDQVEKIRRAIGPAVGYLWRLLERMDQTNLSTRDPKLARLVLVARNAIHGLLVELHYQSCGHGSGGLLATVGES